MARAFASGSTNQILATISPTISSTGTIAFRARPLFSPGESVFRFFFSIVDSANPATSNLKLYRYSDNNLYLDFQALGSNSQASAADTAVWTSGAWASWVITWNNSTPLRTIYVNNVLKMTNAAAFNIPTLSDNAYIGQNNGGASISFYGDMCDIGSSSAQWGATERAMYAAGYTFDQIQPQSINNWWPLISGLSPEPNVFGVNAGAVTGATVSANPPLIFPKRRSFYVVAAAAGGTVTGVGASDGVGAAAGVGAATAAATAASAGTGTALATGAFTLAPTTGVANAGGVGTAVATGAATAAGVGNAAGTGTAQATGASIGIISAVGNAAGTSEALGYSPQLLGGGEAGRGAKGGRARRKRITWLPADYDIETGEPRVPIAAEPARSQPPSVQLTKGERKVARLLAQYRGRDDDVAERAREQLEALRRAEDGVLARFIARQEQLDVQRRAAAAIAAEDDEAAVAFMRWMMSQ